MKASYLSLLFNYFSSLKQSLRNPLASDAGLLTVSHFIAAGFGLLTTIVAARLLGPAKYGMVALIIAYPTLLWSFVSFKPVTVTTRYISGFRATQKGDELISICKLGFALDFISSFAVLILISGTSWWVARYVYALPEVSWLMIIYGASFLIFSLVGTSQAILTSWQRFRWLSFFQIFERSFQFVLVLVFLLSGFGVTGMVIAIALSHAIFGIIMVIASTYVLYHDGFNSWWSASLKRVSPLAKELISFFSWNYVAVTLTGLIIQVPIMLLGRLRGPEEAGFFRLATNITTVGSYMETSMSRVVYPVLSARWAMGEKEELGNTLKRWTLLGGIPAGILLLLLIPFLPIIISFVFGSGYHPMVRGTQIMMIGAAVSAVFFWINSYYYAIGKISFFTKIFGLYTIIAIAAGWFCIQWWGFLGMAIPIAIGKIAFISIMVKLAKHKRS